MNDRDFLKFIEYHFQTENSMFLGSDIQRLYELAGGKNKLQNIDQDSYYPSKKLKVIKELIIETKLIMGSNEQ